MNIFPFRSFDIKVSIITRGYVNVARKEEKAEAKRKGQSKLKMASGCCGTKKQKLNNSSSIPCNGTSMISNGVRNGMVAHPEMCFFCFDVLYSHLNSLDPPKTPEFSNDP